MQRTVLHHATQASAAARSSLGMLSGMRAIPSAHRAASTSAGKKDSTGTQSTPSYGEPAHGESAHKREQGVEEKAAAELTEDPGPQAEQEKDRKTSPQFDNDLRSRMEPRRGDGGEAGAERQSDKPAS